jgi:hypothetical protein
MLYDPPNSSGGSGSGSSSSSGSRLAGYSYVATRGNATISRQISVDSTNNTINSRRVLLAPPGADMKDLIVRNIGWGYNGSTIESVFPNGYTVSTTIEYPLATTPLKLTYGGTAQTVLVSPSFTPTDSDAYPFTITAGTAYAIKQEIKWTGYIWMTAGLASTVVGEWSNAGINQPDHTLDLTALTSTTAGAGVSGIPMAKLSTRIPVLGIIGDSWSQGAADLADPLYPASTTFLRALRNKMPVICTGVGGYLLAGYVAGSVGQQALLKNGITHLLIEPIVNDLTNGLHSLAELQANLQTIVTQYAGRGINLFAWTGTPHSTSTDGFISTGNQTVSSATGEAIRLAYNSWLRTNYAALGFTGLLDAAHVIDPTDSGLWSFDAGVTAFSPANPAALSATISGGGVNAILFAGTGGLNYPASTTLNWTSYAYPGDPGSGATGTVTTNASGNITSYVITTPGTLYTAPPMINLLGPWTADGLHGNPRAWNELIHGLNLGPALFTI